MITNTATTIRRVVSCFLLSRNERQEQVVAVFRRQVSMPTFPSHWAAVSGSIEAGETPLDTARRELDEETNIADLLSQSALESLEWQSGLFVDVPYNRQKRPAADTGSDEERGDKSRKATSSHNTQILPGNIIRVYPFAVDLSEQLKDIQNHLVLRGTEHDRMEWILAQDIAKLDPAVPALATAFHHATRGSFHSSIPTVVREWAADRVSGAASLARQAAQLVSEANANPSDMKMLRPSMVALTNILTRMESGNLTPDEALESLEREGKRAVDLAVKRVLAIVSFRKESCSRAFTIALFSRSSTLCSIIRGVQQEASVNVVCSRSTPGDEGLLMAEDVGGVPCLSDQNVVEKVKNDEIDLVLVGCDCIMEKEVVNKIGTRALAHAAKESSACRILCCSDRSKLWHDVFPPPLEPIFELIDIALIDELVLPSPE